MRAVFPTLTHQLVSEIGRKNESRMTDPRSAASVFILTPTDIP